MGVSLTALILHECHSDSSTQTSLSVFPAGGSALAKKLINTYFTLFHLILEGKAGRAAEIQAVRQSQAEKQRGKVGKQDKKGRHEPKRQPAPKAGKTASAPRGTAVSASR